MRSTYHLALFLMGFPLVTGVLIFLLWFRRGESDLKFMGLMLLLTGWIPVFLGNFLLSYFRAEARRLGRDPRQIRRATWIVVLLGLSNFPAAALVLYGVEVCDSYCAFTLGNESGATVQDIELRLGNAKVTLGSLKPNEYRFRRVFLKPEAVFRLTARNSTHEFDSNSDKYSGPSFTRNMTFVFGESGRLNVYDPYD